MRTFIEAFQLTAQGCPEKTAFTFLHRGEEPGATITFGRLEQRARAIAAELSRTLGPGDRAVLLYPPGLDFIEAFLGCLFAGVIAVPLYPPTPSRMRQSGGRLLDAFRSASPKAILTPTNMRANVELVTTLYEGGPLLKWVHTDAVDIHLASRWRFPASVDQNTIAFLQYTSGSTGAPKGAMVTHRNLLANTHMVQEACNLNADDIIVHWLPAYHDMGLIGHSLTQLRIGISVYFMSPLDFLTRPVRWLRAITRFRGTGCAAPNFGYEFCVRRISEADKVGLDLSSWTKAMNGAEPVSMATLDRFADAFASSGFRKSSFRPVYGLAEATLIVSGTSKDPEPVGVWLDRDELAQNRVARAADEANAVCLVASGTVLRPGTVVIVNPDSRVRCTEAQVGEIWLRGEFVAAGYWRNHAATEETFGARLTDGTGPFMRTGDLGFLTGDHLVVTGRLKDLIIQRGVNYYPQDLERTAETVYGAKRAAAFSIGLGDATEERVVVVVEFDRRRRAAAPTAERRRDEPVDIRESAPSLNHGSMSNAPPQTPNSFAFFPPASMTGAFAALPATGIMSILDDTPFENEHLAISAVLDKIREELSSQHGISTYEIVLVTPGAIPLTSSGKIQRRATRDLYLAQTLPRLVIPPRS